jgi:hypothetical protein
MLKRFLIALCLVAGLLALVVVSSAQDSSEWPEREIYTALAFGDDVFEPDLWRASAEEQETYTSALWNYEDDANVLVYLLYLHFDGGATPEAIDNYFSEETFRTLLANYSPYRQVETCQVGDLRLYEFVAKPGEQRKTLRYWVLPVTDTRVLAVNAVFPDEQIDMLDTYALRLFPEMPSCNFEGVG